MKRVIHSFLFIAALLIGMSSAFCNVHTYVYEGVTYELKGISYDGNLADSASVLVNDTDNNSCFEFNIPINDLLKGETLLQVYLESKIKNIPPDKPLGLKQAENMYVLFMRSLGLPDKAGTQEIEGLCMALYGSGDQAKVNQALMISAKALALINNVTQNGGRWADIEWHEEIQ